jgi:hypothetical protein
MVKSLSPRSLTIGLFSMFFVRTAKLPHVSSAIHQVIIGNSLEGIKGILSKFDAWCEIADQDTHRRAAKRIL